MGWLRGRFSDLAVVGRQERPRRWDVVLTVLLALLLAAEVVIGTWEGLEPEVVAGLVLIAIVPWRRVRPLEVFLAGLAIDVASGALAVAAPGQPDEPAAASFAMLALAYALLRWEDVGHLAVGAPIGLAVSVGTELVLEGPGLRALWVVPAWLGFAAFAFAMRYRAALQVQREASIRLTERNAVARDVHDVVAHHVSAIAVQAQAAQYVAERDPAQAAAALRVVEELANTAIDEMRRMVGVLRSDDDLSRSVTARSLAPLADEGGHVRVALTGETSLAHLPPSVAAAVYRIAQESVTNARRHGRGLTFVDVALRTARDGIALDVLNDGAPVARRPRSGHERGWGLVGMSERVEALGGALEAGPRAGGGWRVRATIPLDDRVEPEQVVAS